MVLAIEGGQGRAQRAGEGGRGRAGRRGGGKVNGVEERLLARVAAVVAVAGLLGVSG